MTFNTDGRLQVRRYSAIMGLLCLLSMRVLSNADDPQLNVNPAVNLLWGHHWPVHERATISIVGEPDELELGHVDVDDGGYWRLHVDPLMTDISAGDTVIVRCGAIERIHIVSALTVAEVNTDNHTVRGTADPHTEVWVQLIDHGIGRRVSADGAGNWLADFSVAAGSSSWDQPFDLEPGACRGVAIQPDAEENATCIQWVAALPAWIGVDPWRNEVHGRYWTPGTQVTLSVNGVPYPQGVFADEWGYWDMILDDVVINAGSTVSAADGRTEISHSVIDFSVNHVDIENGIVSGTAPPEQELRVQWWIDENTPGILDESIVLYRMVSANTYGHWTADFSAEIGSDAWAYVFDVARGADGLVSARDHAQGFTVYVLRVDNPHFLVDPLSHRIWGHEWPPAGPIVVEVEIDGSNQVLGVTQANINGDWYLNTLAHDVRAGDSIYVHSDALQQFHRVTALTLTDVDPWICGNAIYGTAEPYTWVDVMLYAEYIGRSIQADSDGHWLADFRQPGDLGDPEFDRVFDLEAGMRGSVQQSDGQGNATHISWIAADPRPIIRALPSRFDFGLVDLGMTVTQVFDIVNVGKLDLSITDAALINGNDLVHFTLIDETVVGTSLPGRGAVTGQVSVVFMPQTPWDKTVALRIMSDDSHHPEYHVALYGTGRPVGGAQDAFESGLDALADYLDEQGSSLDLLNAQSFFGTALAEDPHHYGAIVYRMFTRFLSLPQDADIADVLDDLGAPEAGRDILNWTATLPDPLPSGAPTLDRIVAAITQAIDGVIDESLDHLSRIPTDWAGSVLLRPDYLPIDNEVQFDAGDVLMVRSLLNGLRGLLLMVRAHDWFFDFKHLDHLDTPRRTIDIDGDPSDWDGIRPIHADNKGNHEGPDSVDLHRIFTAMDATHAYIMIDTHAHAIHSSAPISVILNFKPGRHMWLDDPIDNHSPRYDDVGIRFGANGIIDAWDSGPVTIDGVSVARGEVFEAAIPLVALGNPDYVTVTYVNIWPDGFDGLPGNPVSMGPGVGAYLEDYPELGTITNAGAFPMALASFVEAINLYKDAALSIRAETDWQGDDLFTFDPEMLDVEQQFRLALEQIRDSMTGDARAEPFAFEISRFVDIQDMFDHPFSLRDLQTGSGLQDTLIATFLRQVAFALDNLASVDTTYTQTLTPNHSPVNDELDLDYGDITMVTAWLKAWQAGLHAVQAYDLDADLVRPFEQPADNGLNAFLDANDQWLTLAHPAELDAASNALIAVFNEYSVASGFLRARHVPFDQRLTAVSNNHLLVNGVVLTHHEDRLHQLMMDLNNSMTIARPILYPRGENAGRFHEWLHIGRFFASPYVTRALLPEFDADNRVIPDTWPDATFNGILPDMDQASPPPTPHGLRMSAVGDGFVELAWDEAGVMTLAYQLQRRELPRGKWGIIAETGSTSWTDSQALDAGRRYAYRVRAVNWVGQSAFSAAVIATLPVDPGTPTYAMEVSHRVATIDGQSIVDLDGVVQAFIGATLDMRWDTRLMNPASAARQHRVVAGWRNNDGVAVGQPVEIPSLTVIPMPIVEVAGARLPGGLRLPDEIGDYGLWLESYVGQGDPRAAFSAHRRDAETALAHNILRIQALAPDAANRRIWIPEHTGIIDETVDVAILADVTGGENAFAFSLEWDPTHLEFAGIEPSSAMHDALFLINADSQRVGLVMTKPAGVVLPAGQHSIARARFTIASTVDSGDHLPLMLGDMPTPRRVVDVAGDVIPEYTWDSGVITVVAGLEADVSPRGRPDGVVTQHDQIQIMRFVAGLDVPAPGREFQAADCAPSGTRGDGVIDLRDVVVAGLYAEGFLPAMELGGPTEPGHNPQSGAVGDTRYAAMGGHPTLRVGRDGDSIQRGDILEVPIRIESVGDLVAGASFSVAFDPDELTYLEALPADGLIGLNAILNDTMAEAGAIGVAMRFSDETRLPAGDILVLTLVFSIEEDGPDVDTAIDINGDPTAVLLLDGTGGGINHEVTSATISLQAGSLDGLPAAVTYLIAELETLSRLVLHWTPVPEITGFRVYRQDGDQPWTLLASLDASTRYFVDGGIQPATRYRYRIASVNAAGQRFSDPLSVAVPSRYRFWASERIGPFVDGPDEDADGDGRSNYLEYLMGSDPMTPEQNLLRYRFAEIYGAGTAPFFTVAFDLRPDVDPDKVKVDATDDLSQPEWTPAPRVLNTINNGSRHLKYRVPNADADRQFLRLYTLPAE